MKWIIVRHALAEDKVLFRRKNKNDDLRPLTKKGKKDFQNTSKELKKIIPKINKLYSSPLTRALETSNILEKRYKIKTQVIEELRPECAYKELIRKIKKQDVVMMVGHEPHLSGLISYLIKSDPSTIILKKGAFAILEGGGANRMQLVGLLQPKHLRKK